MLYWMCACFVVCCFRGCLLWFGELSVTCCCSLYCCLFVLGGSLGDLVCCAFVDWFGKRFGLILV